MVKKNKVMSKKEKKQNKTYNNYDFYGILLLVLSFIILFSFVRIDNKNLLGPTGEIISRIFYFLFGYASILIPLILCFYGVNFLRKNEKYNSLKIISGILIIIITISIFITLISNNKTFAKSKIEQFYKGDLKKFSESLPANIRIMDKFTFYYGGIIGKFIANSFISWLNIVGAYIINFIIFMFAIILIGREKIIINSWKFIADLIVNLAKFIFNLSKKLFFFFKELIKNILNSLKNRPIQKEKVKIESSKINVDDLNDKKEIEIKQKNKDEEIEKFKRKEKINVISAEQVDKKRAPVLKTIIKGDYNLPPTSLLEESKGSFQSINYTEDAERLKKTLNDFGIECEVVNVVDGPVISRFELELATGTKVSSVENLAADIALAMKVEQVRIAPVPDKALLGIEVPKKSRKLICLREIIEEEEFQNSPSVLSIALGRDLGGKPIIAELSKMPHLLIAGATGSGKSVCINSIIMSILFKASPDEVKFLLVDPKRVELTYYKDLPHLLAPVITDAKLAAIALKKLINEMESRYEILAEEGAQNIEIYNKMVEEYNNDIKKDKDFKEEDLKKNMPYIVLVIDELADLMLLSKGSVEESLRRLAQLARAVGIHLILATQRPSVDVITGVIKANFPSRIAFQVMSQVDSRTILDTKGAETLLGKGDMLYAPSDLNKPIRGQAALVTASEISKVVNFIKKQRKPEYSIEFDFKEDEIDNIDSDISDDDADIFEKAVKLAKERGEISTSYLQRKLSVGYSKAARLIDEMEEKGLVTPPDGNKPRKYIGD